MLCRKTARTVRPAPKTLPIFFCVSIPTSTLQGLSLCLCQEGPLMFTDHISMPLRRAFSTKCLNCGYCFQLCCMREHEGWALLWALCCSWAEIVLSCEAADIKGHRCTVNPKPCVFDWVSKHFENRKGFLCVHLRTHTLVVCLYLGTFGMWMCSGRGRPRSWMNDFRQT